MAIIASPEETPELLEKASYDTVFDLMVSGPHAPDDTYHNIGASFSWAMAYLTANNPDVFLFTHKSAIPVADSVRAYYEELGMQMPDLGVVNTKEKIPTVTYESQGDRLVRSTAPSPEVIERESKVLRPLVTGKRVAIIDQFIETGTTIAKARELARIAGALSVRIPFAANWYDNAREKDLNIAKITSVHAPQMRNIGHAAARLEMPEDWHSAHNWSAPEK